MVQIPTSFISGCESGMASLEPRPFLSVACVALIFFFFFFLDDMWGSLVEGKRAVDDNCSVQFINVRALVFYIGTSPSHRDSQFYLLL